MVARIFRPAKTAMQSGTAKTKRWVLEYEPEVARKIDPLMGWTSTSDVNSQIRLKFDSKQAAIDFADNNGIAYRVFEPRERKHRPKAYSDNFKFGRIGQWTH